MRNSFPVNITSNSRINQHKNTRIDFKQEVTQIYRMDSERFERAIVEVLTGIIEGRGLRHDPSAQKTWPYKKAAGRTWQAIRSEQTCQKLTLKDAHAMAQSLSVPMSQVCALVEAQELQNPQVAEIPPRKTTIQSEEPPAPGIGEGLQRSLEEVQQE